MAAFLSPGLGTSLWKQPALVHTERTHIYKGNSVNLGSSLGCDNWQMLHPAEASEEAKHEDTKHEQKFTGTTTTPLNMGVGTHTANN